MMCAMMQHDATTKKKETCKYAKSTNTPSKCLIFIAKHGLLEVGLVLLPMAFTFQD